jgi:VanZ family protein
LNQHQLELKKIGILVFVSLCYGIVIELMQELFTTTRHADVFDVLANLTGATIAFLLLVIFKNIKSKTNTP